MAKNCKWAIMIYMAADDAVGIPEAYRFLAELHQLSHLFEPLKVDEEEDQRKVRIFLQAYTDWDTTKDGKDFSPRRFEINSEFSLDNPLKLEKKDFDTTLSMGSAEALTEFINWSQTSSDAEKYLLFLWGHGTGSSMFSRQLVSSYTDILKVYRSLALTDMETGRPIKNMKELIEAEDPSYEGIFKGKNTFNISMNYRGRYYDNVSDNFTIYKRIKPDFYKKNGDTDGKLQYEYDLWPMINGGQVLSLEWRQRLRRFLSTRSNLDALLEGEIRKSLRESKFKRKIDILMIMGCCMQLVEFGFEMKSNCNYLIASEELIYFDGYNYFDSFGALRDYPEMGVEELAKRIVQEAPIKETYDEVEKQSLAISCVNLEKNKSLADYLEQFANLILKEKIKDNKIPDLWRMVRKARKQCRHFGEDAYTYSFIDITWFFMKFRDLIKGKYADLLKLAEDIIDHLENDYILQAWIGNKRTPRSTNKEDIRSYGGHGVGIYFPESMMAHNNNEDLGFFFEKYVKCVKKGNGEKADIFKEYEKSENGEKTELNEKANEFSKKNRWNEMIFTYMRYVGVESNYPLTDSPAPADPEKKKLMEDNFAYKNIVADLLLKNRKTEKETANSISDLLLKIKRNGISTIRSNGVSS